MIVSFSDMKMSVDIIKRNKILNMADSNFFKKNKPSFSAAELAELTESEIIGNANTKVTDLATLDNATQNDLSFFTNGKYKKQFLATKAGICLCDKNALEFAPEGITLLVNSNPYFAYAKITQAFYKESLSLGRIANNSDIDSSAEIGQNVTVSSFAVIGKNCKIGNNVFIGANTVICDGCVIGDNSKIMHNVTITHTLIGNNSVIFSGCRIGQDGFGYAPSAQGVMKVEQLGRVVIGNYVEIGANATIDRGALEDTVIGDGTKIDNLVQIGHNVRIGRSCFIVAQTGIAGSAVVEDGVMLGGQAGVAGHLTIGRGSKIAAQSGIMSDLDPNSEVGGSPAIPVRQWLKITAILKKMTKAAN